MRKDKLKEKRRVPRLNISIPIEYHVVSDFPKHGFDVIKRDILKGKTKDFSIFGIRFPTDYRIPKDTILELNIKFPKATVKALSKVIWSKNLTGSRQYHTGVEFLSIRKEQLNVIIEQYVNRYKREKPSGKSFLKKLLFNLFYKK